MKAILFFVMLIPALLTCKKDPAVFGKNLPKLDIVAKNLKIPWGMGFLPNGDFLFCERKGHLNIIKKGESNHRLLLIRSVEESEGGLLGLAIDPDFDNNHFVFIYETVTGTNRVVRLKYENNKITEDAIILTGIPAANNHDGGAFRFGPDNYLYLGTGDAQQPDLSQDTNSLAGKILRMDRNGNPAPGNPFNNHVWTLGHRNVQGFDWNKQGKMMATEHGPSGDLGWCCHDEINLIEPGKNYGWPVHLGGTEKAPYTPPLYQTGTETWAPSGCSFIKGKQWGDWEDDLIIAALRGQRLIRFDVNTSGDNVLNRKDTLVGTFNRLRNIIQAPDGSILFSSSNSDKIIPLPLKDDDKIYRLSFK